MIKINKKIYFLFGASLLLIPSLVLLSGCGKKKPTIHHPFVEGITLNKIYSGDCEAKKFYSNWLFGNNNSYDTPITEAILLTKTDLIIPNTFSSVYQYNLFYSANIVQKCANIINVDLSNDYCFDFDFNVFPNLVSFIAEYNLLSNLEIKNNNTIQNLDVSYGAIVNVELQNDEKLYRVNISDNLIDTYANPDTNCDIDLENLTDLNCSYNNLNQCFLFNGTNAQTKDFIPRIQNLTCYHCSITTPVDLSGLTMLNTVDITNNDIASINLSGDINLYSLAIVDSYQLTSLNLSSNTNLHSLYLLNTLVQQLDLSNLTNLTTIDIENTPLTNGLTIPSTQLELNYLTIIQTDLTSIDASKFYSNASWMHLDIEANPELNEILLPNADNVNYREFKFVYNKPSCVIKQQSSPTNILDLHNNKHLWHFGITNSNTISGLYFCDNFPSPYVEGHLRSICILQCPNLNIGFNNLDSNYSTWTDSGTITGISNLFRLVKNHWYSDNGAEFLISKTSIKNYTTDLYKIVTKTSPCFSWEITE